MREKWEHSPAIASCASCGLQEAVMGRSKGWMWFNGKAYCAKDVCRAAANLPAEPVEPEDPPWDNEPRREI